MKWKTWSSGLACQFLIVMSQAFGSATSNGPDGINSAGLGLTGAGIGIGQVEPGRPGQMGFDPNGVIHTAVNPTAVFRQDGAPVLADATGLDGQHALQVAGVMISNDTGSLAGVAPDALLYASADNASAPFDPESALTAQHIATQNGGDIRAINFSFGNPLAPGAALDGNSLLTQFVDWSASTHDTLYVVAGNEGTMIPVPTDNFNGLTVAYSDRVGGVYRRVDMGNTFTEDAVGARTSIDLLAPGEMIEMTNPGSVGTTAPHPSGTSFAAPHVTGTVALLQQFAESKIAASTTGWDAEARHHEVMKAVLMNSADKLKDDGTLCPVGCLLGMERTVLKQDGVSTWLNSKAFAGDPNDPFFDPDTMPLDEEMGTGHLNAKRALQQFIPGEFDLTPSGADQEATVPAIGWDFGHTNGTFGLNRYIIDQELQGGNVISITLAWDRLVEKNGDPNAFTVGDTFEEYTDPDADDVINDLDLFLVDSDISTQVLFSIASVGTVEHIFASVPYTGNFEIWVTQEDADVAGGQDYGLAWWYGLAPELEAPGPGDFDGDGDVDGEDLALWEGSYALNDGGDADGDGDSDGDDFLIWQRNVGTGVLSAATAVPEPATGLLAMMVLVVAARRRCW